MSYLDITRVPALRDGLYQILNISEIEPGDHVFDEDGLPVLVQDVAKEQYDAGRCCIVQLTDDRPVFCTEDTLWQFYTRQSGRYRLESTADLSVRMDRYMTVPSVRLGRGCRVDADSDLSVHPYVIGTAAANATLTQDIFILHTPDDDVAEKINILIGAVGFDEYQNNSRERSYCYVFRLDGTKTAGGYRRVHTRDLFKDFPDFAGRTAFSKYIPDAYLYGSDAQRWSLIQGLFDGDGCISVSGKSGIIITYDTTSAYLWHQIGQLLYSLGIEHTMYERDERDKKKHCAGYDFNPNYVDYCITVKCPHSVKPSFFTSLRKRGIADSVKDRENERYGRYVRTPVLEISRDVCVQETSGSGICFVDLKLAQDTDSFVSADNILLHV